MKHDRGYARARASGLAVLLCCCSQQSAFYDPWLSSQDSGTAAPQQYSIVGYSASERPAVSDCLRQVGTSLGSHDFNYTVDWSPTADLLLVGTNGALRLLSVDRDNETLSELTAYSQPDSHVYAKWSPDGRYALSAGEDVRLLALQQTAAPQLSEVARYSGHTDSVIALAWSPDGAYALTASKDETVRLLAVDASRGQLQERALFHGHTGRVFGVAWSPDGRNAVSVGEDRTLRLLAVETQPGALSELAQVIGSEWKNSVSWGDGDRPLLVGDWGLFNELEMWSVDEAAKSLRPEGTLTTFDDVGVQTMVWNPTGTLLAAAAHDDSGLQLFSYADRHFEGVATLGGWHYGVHAASWSHDGTRLAVAAAYTERVVVLDVRACAH